MKQIAPPERRTKKDLLATLAIVIVVAVIVAGVWFSSQQRKVDHHVADMPLSATKNEGELPSKLSTTWTAPTDSNELIATGGGVLQVQGTRASMLDVGDGTEAWHYDQQREICGAVHPSRWKEVGLVFRGPKGCGEVIGFSASTGQYAHTRDALAPENVVPLSGERRAGTLSSERVELWRDDLVRTVEAGRQEAPHQPDQQKYTECRFTSALAGDQILATAQTCPDKPKKLIRLLKATPEDSEEPESLHEFTVPAGAELVAVNAEEAAIYIPGKGNRSARLQFLHIDGTYSNANVPDAEGFSSGRAAVGVDHELHQPLTHMAGQANTWFDGERLHIFPKADLHNHRIVEEALGLGAMHRGMLLVPVREGIAIVEPFSGKTLRTIAVDRGDYSGRVTVGVSGGRIIEQRADTLVGLK